MSFRCVQLMQRGALRTPEELLAGYTSLKPVKRTPLRVAYAGATLSSLLALLPTEPALGHVDVRPRLVEQGKEAVLLIELPQLRAGPPPVTLEVEAEGIEFLASSRRQVVDAETRWSVLLDVSLTAPTGELPLVLRALFADGESVEVDGAVVVVPLAVEPLGGFPWLGVAAAVTLALALGATALLRARRRT